MYSLMADGREVARSAADDIAFVPGSSLLERVNCAASGSITLLPGNPFQDYIALRRSVITIERAGRELFRGQAVDRLENEQGFVKFSILSDLSYLRDGLIAPFTFTGNAVTLIGQLLTEYNAQVAAARQISRGTIGKTGLGTSMSYTLTSWRSAWDIISELVNQYGGFLRLRTGSGGARLLDWLNDSGHFASQSILWGDNLLSLSVRQDATGVVNSIRATSGQELSVLVEDAASIAQYGLVRVHRSYVAETAAQLTTLAQKDLAAMQAAAVQISGMARDKWRDEEGAEPFCVGDFAQTVDPTHRIDQWIMISELRHDLTGGTPEQVTLGAMPKSLTRSERSGVINTWIISTQGRAPTPVYAIDVNERYAVDADGVYGVAKGA